MKSRRALAVLLAAVSATSITACGNDHATAEAESEGTYVTVDSLRYQVQISRQLNPTDVEDRDYLTGVSPENVTLKPDETWFAIFIRVGNSHKGGKPIPTATAFSMEDTAENEFAPIPIAGNPLAYKQTSLGPKEILPRGIEVAAYSPTQGKLLLFKMPNDSLSNRPLELIIHGASGAEGTVEIDV